MEAHACNPSTQEAEAERPCLMCEANLSYKANCLRTNKQGNEKLRNDQVVVAPGPFSPSTWEERREKREGGRGRRGERKKKKLAAVIVAVIQAGNSSMCL